MPITVEFSDELKGASEKFDIYIRQIMVYKKNALLFHNNV
jgi:hypothetical protein